MNKEVYVAYGIEGEVLYIGQGNASRHKHCLGGTSHNRDLNRYYFKNGEDGCIRVEVLHTDLTRDEAVQTEMLLIQEMSPLFNSIIPNGINKVNREKSKNRKPRPNYSKLMKQYIKAVSMNDITRVSEIDAVIPDCKIHLNSLGAKKIASAKYSHNRVNDMYTNYVLKTKYRKDIVKDMGLLVGGTYPNDTVKVLLKESYTKHLIKESASLMNLKFFYEFEEKQIRSGVNRISSINITGVKE